jgi:autotransporter passenger strand-loop-strand repeat protein
MALGYGSLYYREVVGAFQTSLIGFNPSDDKTLNTNTVYATAVDDGGELDVDLGGFSYFATINNGGVEFVYGADGGATINSGGAQYVYGTATDATVEGGGYQQVNAGGTIVGTTLQAGGRLIV